MAMEQDSTGSMADGRGRRRSSTLTMRDHVDLLPVRETDDERPLTRGDCIDGPRPCAWISCRHNLYLDVSPFTGTITLNFPNIEPQDMKHSCSLDVADTGAHELRTVGQMMNMTRERARQIELDALTRLKPRMPDKL